MTIPLLKCAAALLSATFLAVLPSQAGPSQTDENATKDQWVRENLLSSNRSVASFLLNGKPWAEQIGAWSQTPVETSALPNGRTQHVLKWSDPRTGLEVRIVAVDYSDFPAVEWTAYIKNTGTAPSPLVEKLQAIDLTFKSDSRNAKLRTIRGDYFSAASYEPLEFTLNDETRSFRPAVGRSTDTAWPYFNIDRGQEGLIVALGWPGQWSAQFTQVSDGIRVQGNQEITRLRIMPGEEVRTPLAALVFWRGEDWLAGQNLWRRWFMTHNVPRLNGIPAASGNALICLGEGMLTSAAGQIAAMQTYMDQKLDFDYFWVDAGWYESKKDWFSAEGIGTWKPDPVRYPKGLRELTDRVHSNGMKQILWFEPERVYRGSYLWDNHPEWLLNGLDTRIGPSGKPEDDLRLLNFGNPEALKWITDTIVQFLATEGVDVYRQDFNTAPLNAWRSHDVPDRQGMTENLYVQGYLAFWDALLERHPGLLIDSCSGGGRRNDLETLRRGVPLLRSDYQAAVWPGTSPSQMTADVYSGNQGHTYGLSLWLPVFGTGEYCEDLYSVRSHLCPWQTMATQLDDPDWPALRRQMSDQRIASKYFSGDFYPLVEYSLKPDVWMAWQFLRPTEGDGMIQAFRREGAQAVAMKLKLRALKSGAQYEITSLDTGTKTTYDGKLLMTEGLPVKAKSPRTALLFTFQEKK